MQERPLTVSELTLAIKLNLEPVFANIFIKGEISNFKKQTSGHLYFTLKDSEAQISAVYFRGDALRLQRFPKDGDHVSVRGEIKVYPPRGNYQIVVKELEYVGIGELLLKLEALKKEIHSRGWFSQKFKKPLPKMPRRIGIITSPTGAVIQDILNVLSRRAQQVHVILNPVKVQGEGAAAEIAKAINEMNQHNLADVLIVCRGGGSIEDLWAFNEEVVAEAIFRSQIPILCAVGHETDHTIAEYVADLRAPTPSAAAELVTDERATQVKYLETLSKRIFQTMFHIVRHAQNGLEAIVRQPVFSNPYALLGQKMQVLDDLRQHIDTSIRHSMIQKKIRLNSLQKQQKALNPLVQMSHYKQTLQYKARILLQSWQFFLQTRKEQMARLNSTLSAIDPKNLLKNGYSIIFSEKDQSIIKSIDSLKRDDKIKLMLSDGQAIATVEEIL